MNEWLKGTIGLSEAFVSSESELIYWSTVYFDASVDFLRDGEGFPNREINRLTTLLWRLVGNKHIPVTLDTGGKLPSLSMLVLGEKGQEIPYFIMPLTFIQLANENPAMQLGAIVYNASQARDYWTGRLIGERRAGVGNNFHKRGLAFEAEMLLTLGNIFKDEGYETEINDYQRRVLEAYPEGLKSLDPSLIYDTPDYRHPGIG